MNAVPYKSSPADQITSPNKMHFYGFSQAAFVLPFVLAAMVCGCEKKPAKPPPPPEVRVIMMTPTNVSLFQEWVGTVDGFINAQIRAQVTGYLLTQNYVEGGKVKKGDLLFQIDPRPFQAVLAQAEAKLAQDKAQLGKTELDVKRFTPLAKEQAISQEQLDDAIQANLAAEAQVKADEASLLTAQLNIDFTRITSPIDGVAGIAMGQIGDLVGQSGSILTTISTLDPIKVYFQANEQSFLTFWRRFASSSGKSGGDLALELILSNGEVYPAKGKFFLADRQVNPNTGTLQIAGIFPNPDLILRPGQYARIRVQTQTKTNTLQVPQRAVTQLQGSYQVILVDNENKAHIRSVKVGEQIGSQWLVENGLKAGDRVVVEGLQKAKEGTVVNPTPFLEQTNNPAL